MDRQCLLLPAEPEPIDVICLTHDVVVLPEQVDGDLGIYRDELVALKKELLAEGVDVDYLHDQAHRTWRGLKGDVVVTILLGPAAGLVGRLGCLADGVVPVAVPVVWCDRYGFELGVVERHLRWAWGVGLVTLMVVMGGVASRVESG